MKITYLGHSCFMLESKEYRVVCDPYAPDSVPGLKPLKLNAQMVTCSHEHGDHSFKEAVTIKQQESPFKITKIACFHDEVQGTKRGSNTIHVYEANGKRVAHFGDLGHELNQEIIAQLGRLDAVMIPVGGFYTIDAVTAKKICDELDVKTIIPMHYRSKSAGYDVLGTVEEFVKLYDDVRYVGDELILEENTTKVCVMTQKQLF